jgi:hypothetical protein
MVGFLDVAARKGLIKPGIAKAVKTAGVPVLALGALVWVVAAAFASRGTEEPRLYAEFVDGSRNSYLEVQLDRAATSFGAFSASLPDGGRVWPAARVQATPQSSGAVTLRYDGIGFQDMDAHPDSEPGDESPRDEHPPQVPERLPQVPEQLPQVPEPSPQASAQPPQLVLLRLVGRVDPAHHTASVDVWVNGNHHRLASPGEVSGAEAVVSDFLAAARTGDWNKLYDLEHPYMRNGSKRSDFLTAMTSSGAATRISDAETMGSTKYSTTDSGVSFAQVPVRLIYGTGTGATTLQASLHLVVDEGTWKVLSLE